MAVGESAGLSSQILRMKPSTFFAMANTELSSAEIDSVTPWSKLHKLVEPFYSKVIGAGRPPIDLARMLRMYVAQQCFGLSDEGIEGAIYDSQAIRAFVGIDLARESARTRRRCSTFATCSKQKN